MPFRSRHLSRRSRCSRRTAFLVMVDGEASMQIPKPAWAIRRHRRCRMRSSRTTPRNKGKPQADGIVITPSHNPPEDGGFKYKPTNGGPADTTATKWIENRANDLLAVPREGRQFRAPSIKRMSYKQALAAATTHRHDFISAYVADLANIIDFDALKGTTLKLAVDPLGGAGVHYWPRIFSQVYKIDARSAESLTSTPPSAS